MRVNKVEGILTSSQSNFWDGAADLKKDKRQYGISPKNPILYTPPHHPSLPVFPPLQLLSRRVCGSPIAETVLPCIRCECADDKI